MGFHFRPRLKSWADWSCTYGGEPLALAALTTFWFVLELLIVKEQLLACGKDEVGAAVGAC